MAQNLFFEKERLQFLRYIRKNLKHEKILQSCLWWTSPSHIIIKIEYKKKNTSDQYRVENFIRRSVFLTDFAKLADIGFSPAFSIEEKSETETHYIFEKKVVDEHPHGKIHLFMSYGGGVVSYGRDEKGRVWEKQYGKNFKLYKS